MSIKLIGKNKWFVVVHVRKPKNVQRQATIEGSKAEANAKEAELRAEIKNGTAKKNQSSLTINTFGEALNLYKSLKDISHSESVFKILNEKLGHVLLKDIQPAFLEYWQVCQKEMENGTCNRRREWTIAALNLVIERNLASQTPICELRFNPLSWLPKLKEQARDRVLTPEERNRFIEAMEKTAPHLLPMFLLASQVPCRTSELLNLKKGDFNVFDNTIRTKVKGGDKVWKPVPPSMIAYFKNVPEESEYLFYRILKGKKHWKTGLYNPSSFKYVQIKNFYKAWHRSLVLSKVSDFVLHDCRHISATELINNGTPERVVRAIANWKSDMLRIYYHIEPSILLTKVIFGTKEEVIKKCAGECARSGTDG